MSLYTRIALLLNIKTAATLDAAEDPREVLDYAYGEQRRKLHRVRRGRVEMSAARRLIERQATSLRDEAARAEDQARRALRAGREDLARAALERKHAYLAELNNVERQLTELGREEAQLARADRRISLRVDQFRLRRSVLSARYTAAEAQVAATELLEGPHPEADLELTLAVERAEERVEQVGARAAAIEELSERGADFEGEIDATEREIDAVELAQTVETELERLKRELTTTEESKGENA